MAPVETMAPVEFARRGGVAEIILNRPRAINALTHEMVTAIGAALHSWADDDTVRTVLLTGRGDRGLCAGGDVVGLYYDVRDGDGSASAAFWAEEYELNAYIARYPKPFVALMDGVTLGGGVGLAGHAAIRVVTERSKVGMPETAIGFVPDVGGTWLLSHAPGELGTYLGLTALPAGPADAILTGFADHFVPSERLGELVEALAAAGDAAAMVARPERSETAQVAETEIAGVAAAGAAPKPGDASAVVARFAESPPPGRLAADRSWIDAAFSAPTVAEIVVRLRGDAANSRALETAELLERLSPTAVSVTLEALRRAARLPSLEAALAQELVVSVHALSSHDFMEGIRAQVIDKDRTPHWQPVALDDVDPADVAAYFGNE